jgi:hypothetical protein
MISRLYVNVLIFGVFFIQVQALSGQNPFPWLQEYQDASAIRYQISPPEGFERIEVPQNSFADWLRDLPLKPEGSQVYLYNGRLKGNQTAHYRVIDIDPGDKDLQQCADAVMRLKAEYHFICNEPENIHFNFTSGDPALYSRWKEGYRPKISGNSVNWVKSKPADNSYAGFRAYMESVFNYAGTWSLSQELVSIPADQIKIGDVWIQGGFPGHAVIVIDMAEDPASGEKRFMLAQSYMPAQEIHILRNPASARMDPWFSLPPSGPLRTPEWTFPAGSLMRFAN